ncbi:16S rRNA (guanine527-N7)-methyltransferase [Ketogulonicigenium robustum]|uniref:Ribosomal RNA small subunit methyltransferase G n=1 Tax=Ketogulonicigenium robustum TaxID=92947 RepID=A0A1W6P2P1_9RHOB|nr:16S rRNA (guanine(527)-N(7))-methyltransferase RsmG [Ketogulonicigenium robustum]ARO15693.1 16S rRNA (guanine527-N7)-methyltransferase [Ketogulonicigenium robustum]
MSDQTPLLEGVSVSRETLGQLRDFSALVLKWTQKINLISSASEEEIWQRHILDSAQVYAAIPAGFSWNTWADFGSGGGFPGIVIAILASETDKNIILVESDQRKSTFLRTAIRTLGLTNVRVESRRIEDLAPLNADVISARALAALDMLCAFAAPHLADGGICLFPKGRRAPEEIVAARASWTFDLHEIPSQSGDGTILRLEGLTHG